MLSKADVEQYRKDGYVVAKSVLDKAELATLRGKLQELLEGARGLTGHTDVYDLEPFHKPDDPRVRRIKTPHKFFPLFREFVQNPKLLRILQQLSGPAVRLHGSKINIKAPQGGAAVEWHQDWAFYPHTNDDVLAVGVMLDDCMMENGPLMILPGTHTGPVYDHHFDGYFAGAMDPTRYGLDPSKAVALTAPAGSMSFHHARVLHASAQNTSNAFALAPALRVHRRRRLATERRQRSRRVQRAPALGRADARAAAREGAGPGAAAAGAAPGLDLREPARHEEGTATREPALAM